MVYFVGFVALVAWLVVLNRILLRPGEAVILKKFKPNMDGTNAGLRVRLPDGQEMGFGTWARTVERHKKGETIVVSWRPGGPFGPHAKYGKGLKVVLPPLIVALLPTWLLVLAVTS